MADTTKQKKEALGYIDAAITILEKYPNLQSIDSLLSLGVTANPFGFLIDICRSLGCYEQMLQWLVNFLTATLPAVELGVKGILLSNIKSTISCSSDPRIPNYMRKPNTGDFTTVDTTKGLLINIGALDYMYMLSVSPLSDVGKTIYFGTDGMINTYQLARAKDFNAFMWFAIHKANFPSPTVVNGDVKNFFNSKGLNIDRDNLLGVSTITPINSNSRSGILVGNSFIQRNNSFSTVLNICIDTLRDENGNIAQNTLLPVSSDWQSVNWYVDSGTYFDFLKPEESRVPRDYGREKAICNLRFVNNISAHASYIENTQNKLQLTILPKPFVHLPHNGEPAWRIQRILFNENGEPDKNGKYSCRILNSHPVDRGDSYSYSIVNQNGIDVNTLFVYKNDGSYTVENDNIDGLYECYPGLTVYEFNYDYVMGMQLFDAKVVTSKLLNLITNLEVGVSLNLNKTQIEAQQRIAEVVKNIIESDAFEVSDCYFTFSNEKYNQMSNAAELKKLKQQPFEGETSKVSSIDTDSIINILNEFSEEGTLEENKDVITRAINQVTASITEGVEPEDIYGVQVNIICELVQGLVNSIVDSLLSPKLVLLFEVNKRLMGDSGESLSIDDFLNSIMNIIVAIIKEIRDLILKELLDFVLEQLQPIFELLADKIFMEQAMVYRELLRQMIKACGFGKGKKAELETQIDSVDYADIDPIEQPKTDEC
jgi:hypothetical protein